MGDADIGFHVNWLSLPIFLVFALGVALYAKNVSGSWARPWLGTKPVWWFVLLFLLPPFSYLYLVVTLLSNRHTPEAITGRRTRNRPRP